DRLRAENRQLATAARQQAKAGEGGVDSDTDRAKEESTRCVNNLKQIGLAFRVYALDNNDCYPSALHQFTNELSTPKILICPSDTAKFGYGSLPWSEFRTEMINYQVVLSGTND